MNYKETASEIIKNIGGKENIVHLEHCSTRLRFTLKDDSKADSKKLENIKGVMGVRKTAQCQVIIGNEVVEVYEEVIKEIGQIENNEVNNKGEKKNYGAVLLDFLVSIFQPLVPAIAGGGVLKSILILLSLTGIMSDQSQTYQILNLVGGAPLYFLPLLVAMTTAKKLKVNQLVAISAVGALMLPDMTAMLSEGAKLFSFQVENIAYASQVFPAILTVLFYAQMEKFFTKYSLKSIRIFFVPMMSLVITVPVALLILGPLGFNAGSVFSTVIVGTYEHFGWVATGVLAAVLPLMVVTGMHKAMLPYAISAMGEFGAEMLYLPASLAHNIAESGACFAVSLKTKDKELKATSISAGISALFGITEPALYGVTVIHKKVLYSVMASSLVGGVVAGAFALKGFALVGPGLASITMFADKANPMNLVWAFVTLGISFVIAFVLVLMMFKDKEEEVKVKSEVVITDTEGEQLTSPVIGELISLDQVNDEVFSSGMVGDGIGIIPSKGVLYAPYAGEITMIFDTKHALGMKLENGAELLFHVGIDTVQMEGVGFETFVEVGNKVNAGDKLVSFDLDKIKEFGLDSTVIFVVTNPDKYKINKNEMGNSVTTNDLVLNILPN
ncbi:PTS glucose transporter subunit IIA [Vagococcus fluvialis]|uniref:beta-glucoside-specific PTS transporter subunit IIABC n=1 Tax=Vagococcus fluvialis TaxID=2738 RepID=UPI001A8D7A90|nr:beta-glucoside-specific PTS transporter subunit IIABC [Vagococcus fluvialis]MBO0428090.1 PTS glucose transporter subunit IIA [Vagococcus fluvialis]